MTTTPRPFAGLWCHCPERHYQAVSYYVTVRRDNGDARALAGPFAEHSDALAHVEPARRLALDYGDPRAHWYSYGTAALFNYAAPGIFNAALGLPGEGR